MTWQRRARFVVAGVGLATAAAIVLLIRDPPPPPSRGDSAPLDPGAALQSEGGVSARYRDNQRVASIEYEAVVQHKDGRTTYAKAVVTLSDGSVLSAGQVESSGKATTSNSLGAELTLTKGVRLTTRDGATLAGDSATHNDATGISNIPGAATFSRGRMSGRGTGAVYERDTGNLRVLADVVVTLQDDAGGPVEATAATMTFASATRSMAFDRQARITRKTEVLSADRAMLFLSDDDQFFRAIELRGRSKVTPAPGAAATGMPDMQAADIDLAFHDGTQALSQAALNGQARMVVTGAEGAQEIEAPRIDLKTAADGRTLTDLRAGPKGVVVRLPASPPAPARTIEAATLAATGNDKSGLLGATFTDAVHFTETVPAAAGRAASTREGRSGWLMLDLGGRLNAVTKATFRQDVTFVSKQQSGATTTGSADVGVYDAAAGQLELTPSTVKPVRLPHVADADVTVDARSRIVVGLNSDSLEAHGGVTTLSLGKAKGAARGFFTPGERVVGASESLRRDPGTKTLRYTASKTALTRLQQGDSIVEGREIVVSEETSDLEAKGQVRSTVLFDAPAGKGAAPAAPSRYVIDAETMSYVEKQRTATYTGAPVVLKRPDGTIRSTRMTITLARDERRLDRLVATGTMTATLDGGREAKGDQLAYDAAADRYTVRGSPVRLRTRADDGRCTLSRGEVVHFVGTQGQTEWRPAENTGGADQTPFSCTDPLP